MMTRKVFEAIFILKNAAEHQLDLLHLARNFVFFMHVTEVTFYEISQTPSRLKI